MSLQLTSALPSLLLACGLFAACGDGKDGSITDPDASTSDASTSDEPTTGGLSHTSHTDSEGSESEGSESEGSATDATTGDDLHPDPSYRRDCVKSDFVCDDWGCESPPDVIGGECYKPCTPDSADLVGEPDSECDEPERPFCSQVGRAFGGDFDCNGCVHICVSAAMNRCEAPIDQCSPL